MEHQQEHQQAQQQMPPCPPFDDCMPNDRPTKFGLWDKQDRGWLQHAKTHYERVWRHQQQSSTEQQQQRSAGQQQQAQHGAAGGAETGAAALKGGAAEQRVHARVHQQRQCCIPHTIHHIWLGGDMPQEFVRLRDDWAQHHDDWEMRLWGDADVDSFGLRNRAAFDAAANYGEKSDIFRYEVLLQHGGVYVDTDLVCLRPIGDMCDSLDLFVGLANVGAVEVNNGIIGCAPGHPIMRRMVDSIAEQQAGTAPPPRPPSSSGAAGLSALLAAAGAGSHARGGSGGAMAGTLAAMLGGQEAVAAAAAAAAAAPQPLPAAMGTIARTGPGLLTRTVMGALASGDACMQRAVVLPVLYFYPLPNTRVHTWEEGGEGRPEVPAVARAVHLWARSWQKQAGAGGASG